MEKYIWIVLQLTGDDHEENTGTVMTVHITRANAEEAVRKIARKAAVPIEWFSVVEWRLHL